MINLPLLKKELKSQWIVLLIFLSIITMYCSVIVYMFDDQLADTLSAMANAMPELFKAFSMANSYTDILGFITNYLYGIILVIIPCIGFMVISIRLVCQYVTNGSMAYLLSNGVRRTQLILTQLLYLVLQLILFITYISLLLLVLCDWRSPGQLDTLSLLQLNSALFGFLLMNVMLFFLTSVYFNDTKNAYSVAGGYILYSYLMQMLSSFSDQFSFLRYFTPFTLFDPQAIIHDFSSQVMPIFLTYFIAVILVILAMKIFKSKDLSI